MSRQLKIPRRANSVDTDFILANYRLGPKKLAQLLSPLTNWQVSYVLRQHGIWKFHKRKPQ